MLLIDIPRIPPEGMDLDVAPEPASLHVDGESEFQLLPGVRLVCHIELVDGSTVHVRGRLAARIEPECGRCLERYDASLDQELDVFYLPRSAQAAEEQEEEVELTDRDVVVSYYDGEQLDLGSLIREQLFLSLPLKRLCREGCRGLCPSCGKNRNAGDCGCPSPQEPEDPRLLPLRRLFEKKN